MKGFVLGVFLLLRGIMGFTQSYEIEVLLLNFEKLNQMRQIVKDMKAGYEVISQGYGIIKNIAEGNFSLHDLFLDKMMSASPVVRNYYKVAEIISYQVAIVREYKEGWKLFNGSVWLRPGEIQYLESLYSKLFTSSLESLDGLMVVISGRSFRMTDDERLARIDRIHAHMKMDLIDLKKINSSASGIIYERSAQAGELDVIKSIQGNAD